MTSTKPTGEWNHVNITSEEFDALKRANPNVRTKLMQASVDASYTTEYHNGKLYRLVERFRPLF